MTLPQSLPTIYDVAIVGAGPAGLAAAHGIREAGATALVIDSGKPLRLRDRFHPEDNTSGIGGAGLFSDGKFSFFPASTQLWRLTDREGLRRSYNWAAQLLGVHGMDVPAFPEESTGDDLASGEWTYKPYPSFYLPLDLRLEMTDHLQRRAEADFATETRVLSWRFDDLDESFLLRLLSTAADRKEEVVRARSVIFAGGRFGALWPTRNGFEINDFLRLEVGFRIEQAKEDAFFSELPHLDPKLRFRDPSGVVEWRTFCACRDGETVLTKTNQLWSVSGRADCPPTGWSNIGFNARILDEEEARRSWSQLRRALGNEDVYFRIRLQDFLAGHPSAHRTVETAVGEALAGHLLRGLELLASRFPSLLTDEATLVGPTMEGVGWYPKIDGNLRFQGGPAWVAGDACGRFRGIVAALVSGYYAGHRYAAYRGA